MCTVCLRAPTTTTTAATATTTAATATAARRPLLPGERRLRTSFLRVEGLLSAPGRTGVDTGVASRLFALGARNIWAVWLL